MNTPVNATRNLTLPPSLLRVFQAASRPRLEIALAVAIATAAAVGLSRLIPPDPTRLKTEVALPQGPTSPSVLETRPDDLRPEPVPHEAPKVAPEFARAVADKDLAAMARLYRTGMPLDDMLFVAATTGDKEVVTWLLDHGADVHEDESTPHAPILVADAQPEIVSLLLARGTSEPPLTAAATAGAVNAVTRLLANKVDPNPPEGSPLTLVIASERVSEDARDKIVDMLLAAGSEPNRLPGYTTEVTERPLTAAVRICEGPGDEADLGGFKRPCVGLVRKLVRHGATADGDSLAIALGSNPANQEGLLAAVMEAKVEPGATAIALARAEGELSPAVIRKIVARGVDWTWHDGEDDAAIPLLTAVRHMDRSTVEALLAAGAPLNHHSKSDECALGIALDVLANDETTNAIKMVELLLARGADVNRRLPDGRTPLFAAAEGGNLRIVKALLDRGARPSEIVLDETAVDAAERTGHTPAARVIHARGGRRERPYGYR